jgi:glycolate oxidase
MKFKTITPADIQFFEKTLPQGNVLYDVATLNAYGKDETEDLVHPPEVVLKPSTVEEIQNIMKYCYEQHIPVTPIGGRTGLSGGCLSVYGGVGLSMEKFNKIISIDENNLQATVEPGVITQVFQEACIKIGLFYPPDPSSRGSCFIGGNVAENSGGPKAVKYGVVKDYVINLEVVLPNGEKMWTGANVLKNATGYNLTQLFVGSEGTLGIITKIVFKLIPYPTQNLLLLAPFFSAEMACKAVAAIFKSGITPSCLEFMEKDAIDWTLHYVDDIVIPRNEVHMAHLLVEVDGNDLDTLYKDCEKITEVLQQFECDEILFADDDAQKNALWKLRRRVAEAVKANSIYKEEDTVVPRYHLPQLLKGVKEIGAKYGFKSVCYGHAGDGNLHVNIIKGNLSDDQWHTTVKKGIVEIFELTHSLGGTISGEHGIGLVQKDYLPIVFSPISMQIQKQIKQLFDEKGIMNPGKVF